MDKTVVGLNAATRSRNVYPDRCWFAVLYRFWVQCSRTLRRMAVLVHASGEGLSQLKFLAQRQLDVTLPSHRKDSTVCLYVATCYCHGGIITTTFGAHCMWYLIQYKRIKKV
jgi:hypothetical protein